MYLRYIRYISDIFDISVKSKYRYIRQNQYFHSCLIGVVTLIVCSLGYKRRNVNLQKKVGSDDGGPVAFLMVQSVKIWRGRKRVRTIRIAYLFLVESLYVLYSNLSLILGKIIS